jgi:hypothetical protein
MPSAPVKVSLDPGIPSRLNAKPQVGHSIARDGLLQMKQDGSLSKVQLLQRDRVGCIDVQHAVAKIADPERRSKLVADSRCDRVLQLVDGEGLYIAAPGHQLADQRTDAADVRPIRRVGARVRSALSILLPSLHHVAFLVEA